MSKTKTPMLSRVLSNRGRKTTMIKAVGLFMAAIMAISIGAGISLAGDAESVNIRVDQDDLLDVVLTLGNSDSDVSTLEEDLMQALTERGILPGKTKIQAVESSEVSAGNTTSGWEIYDHTNFNDSSVIPYYRPFYNETNGNYVLSNHIAPVVVGDTTNIDFYGYGAPAYKDFMYMPNNEYGKKTFDFTIQEGEFYDALNGAGFLFNTSMTTNTDLANRKMSGYLLLFRYPSSSPPPIAEIYRFSNIDVNAFHNNTNTPIDSYTGFSKLASFSAGSEKTRVVKIEATASSFKMWYNNSLVNWSLIGGGTSSELALPTDFGAYGFGPLVGYLSHGCSRHTHFTFYSVRMTTESSKRFSEVIREPEWRNESKRFIINAEDGSVSDFSDPQALGEILARLGNESIHYLGWGRDETDGNAFITKNGGNGVYIDKDVTLNYEEQIDAMADYIYSVYSDSVENDTEYLIYGKPNELIISPESEKTNTADANWPDGKWRVVQNASYYENGTGLVPYNGLYLNNLDITFSETGKYDIYYQDVLVKTVFVHRKPVARFGVTVDESLNVGLTDLSYDPDYESAPNKGIASVEWAYKETTADAWIPGIPDVFASNKNYVIRQVVADGYGVYSDPYYRYVSTDEGAVLAPVAEFKVTPGRLLTYISETVGYTDMSYDPQGEAITGRLWTITLNGETTHSGAEPMTDFSGRDAGTYKITLSVQNASGIWSETVARYLTVVRDVVAPTVSSNTASGSYSEKKVITLSFEDETGGSGFSHRYAVASGSADTPASWGSMGTNSNYSVSIKNLGDNYIHYRAYDYAGNEKTGFLGPFTLIDTLPPAAPSLNTSPVYEDASWANGAITVTAGGATDDFTSDENILYDYAIDGGEYVRGKDAVLNTEGTHTVTFKATDESGNSSTVSKTVKIDLTAPSTPDIAMVSSEADYEPGTWAADNVSVTINGSTDAGGSGLHKYQYKIGEEAWQDGEAFTLTTSGKYTVSYRSVDNAGNTSPVGTTEIKLDLEVPGGPQVVYTPPYTTEWTNQVTTLTARLAQDNLTDPDNIIYEVSTDGSNFLKGNSVTLTTQGVHTVWFKVTDESGNSTTVSRTVKIDLIAPAVPDIAMAAGGKAYIGDTWTPDDVTITLSGSSDIGGSGFKKYQYKINDGKWRDGNTCLIDVSGAYSISYRAIDGAGNVSAAGTKTVKLDKQAPKAFGIKTTVTAVDSISIKAGTTDTLSGMAAIAYRVFDGRNWSAWKATVDEILTGYSRGETVSIKVEARDTAGNIRQVETTSVTLENTIPVAHNDAFTIREDAPETILDVLANDFDADIGTGPDDSIKVTKITPISKPATGRVTLTNGEVAFKPAADYYGTFVFTYTIADEKKASASAVVIVTVEPVNDPPVLISDSAETYYGQPVTINVLANDSDADSLVLILTAVSKPQNGSAQIIGNKIRYTPAAGFTGTDSFTYTVSDGEDQRMTSVTVKVSYPDNFKPSSAMFTLNDLGDNGNSGGNSGMEVISQPSKGSVEDIINGTIYTPFGGGNGVDSYRVTVEDDGKRTEYQVITYTDANTGKAETLGYGRPLSDTDYVMERGTELVIDLSASIADVDWENVKITVSNQPLNGDVWIEDGKLRYRPERDFFGTDAMILKLSIGDEEIPYAAVIRVVDVQQPILSVWCIIGWILAAIALVLNYLRHREYYDERKSRLIRYILINAAMLILLCLLRLLIGYWTVAVAVLYIAGNYLYAAYRLHHRSDNGA